MVFQKQENCDLESVLELVDDPAALCAYLFKINGKPVNLSKYQEEIVSAILYKEHSRVAVMCSTQAGKSISIALALLASSVISQHERIVNISASNKQATVIFQYVKEHLFDHPVIGSSLLAFSDDPSMKTVARLNREEISWKRNNVLRILSAEAGSPPGEGMLGFTATILVIDERASIKDEIYRKYIRRMLGSAEEDGIKKIMVEVGTPHRRGLFYDTINDPNYHKIIADCWRAVKEGRMDLKFVQEQQRILTPLEFSAFYECKPPDEGKNQVIPWTAIDAATKNNLQMPEGHQVVGIDPASGGEDLTVFTRTAHAGDMRKVLEIESWRKDDPATTVGNMLLYLQKYPTIKRFVVDWIGIGEGIMGICANNLKLKDKVQGIKGSWLPTIEKDELGPNDEVIKARRFKNMKAEIFMDLAAKFNSKIPLIQIPAHPQLINQLGSYEVGLTEKELLQMNWPGERSPDFADSLALSCIGNSQEDSYSFWKPRMG